MHEDGHQQPVAKIVNILDKSKARCVSPWEWRDRRRLDIVMYGATTRGGALCCDATLVSPLTRTGHTSRQLTPSSRAEAHKHCWCGGPRLAVDGAPGPGASSRGLVCLRAQRAPSAVRGAAASAWARRWWGALSVAAQLAVASTALGRPWPAAARLCSDGFRVFGISCRSCGETNRFRSVVVTPHCRLKKKMFCFFPCWCLTVGTIHAHVCPNASVSSE